MSNFPDYTLDGVNHSFCNSIDLSNSVRITTCTQAHLYFYFLSELLFFSFFSYIFYKNKLDIQIFVTGLLGGLVGVTGNYVKSYFEL